MKRTLEVCCGDIESVIAAEEAGAERIELCSCLEVGGMTPSLGLAIEARKWFSGKIFVLIRPRGGDFTFTDAEKDVMVKDIEVLAEWVDGFVTGALDEEGMPDEEFCEEALYASRGKEVTFHRAFDVCSDRTAALEQLIDLGYDRILTSGGAPDCRRGIAELRRLNRIADGRITILAGGGVNSDNAGEIAEETGVTELHGSCRTAGSAHSDAKEIRRVMNSI